MSKTCQYLSNLNGNGRNLKEIFPSLIGSLCIETVGQKNLKYLEEGKKSSSLKSCILKTRGQKCSFQKQQLDNSGTKHLQNEAQFSRDLLSSFGIIFSMFMFIPSSIKKKCECVLLSEKGKGVSLYLDTIFPLPPIAG